MTVITISKDGNTENFRLDEKFLQYQGFFKLCQKLKLFCRYWGAEKTQQTLQCIFYILQLDREEITP